MFLSRYVGFKTRGFPRVLACDGRVKKPRFKINTFFQKIKILFFRKNKGLAILQKLKFKA